MAEQGFSKNDMQKAGRVSYEQLNGPERFKPVLPESQQHYIETPLDKSNGPVPAQGPASCVPGGVSVDDDCADDKMPAAVNPDTQRRYSK